MHYADHILYLQLRLYLLTLLNEKKMKYYLDTEFIEGFHKPTFGKKRHFIALISIAIVSEDGREYYAISNEYNYKDADPWVKDNVIMPLYIDMVHGDARNSFDVHNFHKHYGISNNEIAQKVFEFCTDETLSLEKAKYYGIEYKNVEFYGYYSDYDWVLFCSLFGRMIDLPKGFPMYCKDLKQELDGMYMHQVSRYPDMTRIEAWLQDVKSMPNYPKQDNEHSALDDAKWNKALHEFLLSI